MVVRLKIGFERLLPAQPQRMPSSSIWSFVREMIVGATWKSTYLVAEKRLVAQRVMARKKTEVFMKIRIFTLLNTLRSIKTDEGLAILKSSEREKFWIRIQNFSGAGDPGQAEQERMEAFFLKESNQVMLTFERFFG